jgi:hypothetical protein
MTSFILAATGCAHSTMRGGGKPGPSGSCENIRLGQGTVERTLNEHYSLVKMDPVVKFEEGTIVEKGNGVD